jgi:pimeloyl-ACP methyl ester carboxylesterase
MMLAAQKGGPIRQLVLNDGGAFVSADGLNRIDGYLGDDRTCESIESMEAAVRVNNAPYGLLTNVQWRKLTIDSAREKRCGYGFNYDTRLGDPYKAGPVADVDLWAVWDAVRCPTLIVRGESSDILAHEVAKDMTVRGPKAKLVQFAGIGHAPQLLSDDQIHACATFSCRVQCALARWRRRLTTQKNKFPLPVGGAVDRSEGTLEEPRSPH